jgi:hypothetical protein
VEQAGEQAMKDWRPHIDLDRLTAALGADILGASDEEIRAYAVAGRSVAHAADDVRRQIAAASGEPDAPDPKLPLNGADKHLLCVRQH